MPLQPDFRETAGSAGPRVLVVGAGPAGLAAAVTACEFGLRVTVVDEATGPGGQYLSDATTAGGKPYRTAAEDEGAALIARLQVLNRASSAQLEVMWGATVWSLSPGAAQAGGQRPVASSVPGLTAMIYQRGANASISIDQPIGADQRIGADHLIGSVQIQADAVILATGARETVVPFPGWTLPGVMTAGAAQLLAKRHKTIPVTPGERVLVAGSGPLLLTAAAHLVGCGARVVGIVESTQLRPSWIRRGGSLRGFSEWAPELWSRMGEGWHYLAALRGHRVPYFFGRAVVAATPGASGRVETVDVVRLDRQGEPVPGTTETWPVDLLCVSQGLAPNIELAHLAGARVVHDPARGGWVVDVDASSRVQTSQLGLFVAGEAAGINGASSALLSGRLAGMSAAVHLGLWTEGELRDEVARTARRRRGQDRFGALLNLLFSAPDGLYRAIPDDTPVCRCEEVRAGQVRSAIATGARSLDALKPALRAGQGLCQGRTCGPTLARMLALETGRATEASGVFQTRPPVRPVPLAAIARVSDPAAAARRSYVVGDAVQMAQREGSQ